jgi:hypothetical protein
MSFDALRPDPGGPRRPPVRVTGPGLAVALALLLLGASVPEDEMFRRVKVDVFDQNWTAVLRGCEELLARYPSGTSAPQAAFYRARALTHIPERGMDGLKAFREFIAAYPRDKVMVEQAWAALFSVACEPRATSSPRCLAVLRDGLGSDSRYVSTLAAIRASDTADEDLRRRSLLILKKTYDTQSDPEIRNEILIAILKIDPQQVPSMEPARTSGLPEAPGKAAGKKPPSLIRMTVYDKQEKRYELKVNLPVAFARMLIDAVEEDQKQELRNEARQKGINLDDIFGAIEKSGAGKLLEVDDDSRHIEIWIE